MILNIPVNFDDAAFEEKIEDDALNRVVDHLINKAENTVKEKSYYGRDFDAGMQKIIENSIDKFIDEHKDQIIELAADRLADRLSRTKKAKALLDECMEAKDER